MTSACLIVGSSIEIVLTTLVNSVSSSHNPASSIHDHTWFVTLHELLTYEYSI